jgi:colanic acid biosynthesis glycosyl transferase WcaI
LRLLIVSLNYAPELTATGKYTGELAEWLAGRGHQVEAIAGLPHYPDWEVHPDYRGKGVYVEPLNGVGVFRTPHYVPRAGRVSASGRILMECSFTLAALRWWIPILMRRSRYDVVIAVCPPMQDALMPWVYGLIRRVPWVFHIQDFQVDAAVRLGMLKVGAFGRLIYAIENFLVRRASRVSTITQSMQQRALDKGASADRSWLVPNWADISRVRPGPRDNEFRRSLGLGGDQVLVMYAGGMGAKQGLEVVVQTAELLKGDRCVQFVMVGTGADRSRLESKAQELGLPNLRFLPVQPLERLSEMLAAGDIHLIVQRAEAADLVMPSKLTNILAAGRASIATTECGTALHDVLVGHDCGLCVAAENAVALRDAIVRLGGDVEVRERMGASARAYAETYLDRDAILGRFETQLRQLVSATE